MPTISSFYGIIMVMYLRNKEHDPPHIHAITQDFDAPFLIADGEIMERGISCQGQGYGKGIYSKESKRTGGYVGEGTVQETPAT